MRKIDRKVTRASPFLLNARVRAGVGECGEMVVVASRGRQGVVVASRGNAEGVVPSRAPSSFVQRTHPPRKYIRKMQPILQNAHIFYKKIGFALLYHPHPTIMSKLT